MNQTDLFTDFDREKRGNAPLAHLLRPEVLEEMEGMEELLSRYPFLKSNHFPGLILFGPPGSGKTTLAEVLAKRNKERVFLSFNAVLGGLAELRELLAPHVKSRNKLPPILFIDEIHRFNKAQQDALLPHVEKGEITLIGATTENPRTTLNKALLSRVKLIELKELSGEALDKILEKGVGHLQLSLSPLIKKTIRDFSGGDARRLLSLLELMASYSPLPEDKELLKLIKEHSNSYDKSGDRHYDVISAFIKSMRGSDVDAALLWLAVMIEGGEDPVFIVRRMIIFASEDIGNADPQALILATSSLSAIQAIGMPEGRIILSQVVCYLALAPKSNRSYLAIDEALQAVRNHPTMKVPAHLQGRPAKDAPPYLYPHSFSEELAPQNYSNFTLPEFYRPKNSAGEESLLSRKIQYLKFKAELTKKQ